MFFNHLTNLKNNHFEVRRKLFNQEPFLDMEDEKRLVNKALKDIHNQAQNLIKNFHKLFEKISNQFNLEWIEATEHRLSEMIDVLKYLRDDLCQLYWQNVLKLQVSVNCDSR